MVLLIFISSPSINALIIANQPDTAKNTVEQTLKATNKLISQKRYKEAYVVLKPMEFANINNIKYNYQLGVASLRSGKFTDALYALDRVVSEDPNNIGAQLDMAISYYYLGNDEFAQQELNRILVNYGSEAPEVVIRTVTTYLERIQSKEKKTINTIVSMSSGWSDNINSGYDGNLVYIPLIGANTILSKDNQKIAATFLNAQIVIDKTNKINRSDSISATVVANKKKFRGYDRFNQANLILSGSAKRKVQDKTYTVSVSTLQSYLAEQRNYQINSLNFSVKKQPNKTKSYTVSIKGDRMRFAKEQSKSQDEDKKSLSLTYSDLISKVDLGVTSTFVMGHSKMLDSHAANGNNLHKAGKLTFKGKIFNTMGSLSVGYKDARYANVNASFGVKRADISRDITFEIIKPLQKQTFLDLSVGYKHKKSNIELYNNNATTISFGIKRMF